MTKEKDAHRKWPIGRVYIDGLIVLLHFFLRPRAHMFGYCLPVAKTLQCDTFQQQEFPSGSYCQLRTCHDGRE